MKTRMMKVALVVGAMLAGVGLGTDAFAGTQYDCQSGLACVWKDASFQGSRLSYNLDVNGMQGLSVGNDQVSSAFNRTGVSTRLWEHNDCRGSKSQTIASGVAKSSVTYNDKASSLDIFGQKACGW